MKKNLILSASFIVTMVGGLLTSCGKPSECSCPSSESKTSEVVPSTETVPSSEPSPESSESTSSEETPSSTTSIAPSPTVEVAFKAEPIPNRPRFKLFFESDDQIDKISVTVAYRKVNSKTTVFHLDQYDLMKGCIEVEGNFGINNVTAIAYSDEEFSEKKEMEVKLSAKEYNICPLIATVPVTIYSLSFPTYTNNYQIPTLFYLERGTAWDYSHLPENTYAIPLYNKKELLETRRGNYQERAADYVKELYSIDSTSKFNFYVNDMWCDAWFMSVYPLKMPEEQFTVKLLSDGTWSYSWFNGLFNIAKGQDNRTRFQGIWERAKAKMKENGDFKSEYLEGTAFRNLLLAWIEDASLKGRVTWLINRIDTIQSDDYPEMKQLIADLYAENTIQRFNFGTMYSNLSDEDKGVVKALYNLGDYFSSSTEKGHTPVIALGTNKEPNLEEFLKISQDVFGETYDLYYKGHPAHPTYDGDPKIQVFEKLGVEELPASLAAELFYYFYPENVKYCGYGSSTFTNVGDDPSVLVWNERYETRNASYGDNIEYFVTTVDGSDAKYKSVVTNADHSFFLVQNVDNLEGEIFKSVTAYEFDDVEMVGKQIFDYDSQTSAYVARPING